MYGCIWPGVGHADPRRCEYLIADPKSPVLEDSVRQEVLHGTIRTAPLALTCPRILVQGL